jgi:hypothetical protein
MWFGGTLGGNRLADFEVFCAPWKPLKMHPPKSPPYRSAWRRPRLPSAGQERRIEELRRAFQRRLNRRPTLIEKAAMLRAAALVARAEALALDPNADVNEVVKLNNLVSRALRSLPGERGAHARLDPDAPLAGFGAQA